MIIPGLRLLVIAVITLVQSLVLAMPTADAKANLYGPLPSTNAQALGAWHTAGEWGGLRPQAARGWVKFTIPAMQHPGLKGRSEAKFSTSGKPEYAQAGMTASFDGWFIGHLGPAAYQPRHWHTIAQLIGPNYDGTWQGGAAVSLVVRQGRIFLDGPMRAWSHDLGPYGPENGIAKHIQIGVTLSPDASRGQILVTIDGRRHVFYHKTFWHRYLLWSHGLYRGSGNTPGVAPTYAQWTQWRINRMGLYRKKN